MGSRGRRIVAITATRFHAIRCWFGFVPLISLVFFVLAFQGHILVNTTKPFNDYVVTTVDHQSQFNSKGRNVTSKFEKIEDYLINRNPITHSKVVGETKATTESERRDGVGASAIDTKNVHVDTHNDNMAMKQKPELRAVLHFPAYLDDGIEMRMELDGLVGSQAFHLVSDVNASMTYPNVVWIGSPIPRRLCHMGWLLQAMEYYRMKNPKRLVKPDWTFHLLDWDDRWDRLLRCENLDLLVGQEKVHFWKRSIVSNRHWNTSVSSIELGRISTKLNGVDVHPLHLSNWTDIVEGIASAVTAMTNQTMTPREISDYIVTKDRPGDVAHHWPARGGGVGRGSRKGRNDLLRTATSLTLERMTEPPYNLSDVFCGMHGAARDKGRESTNNAYIDSMLRYKIIVVSQRDVFEGHLRLFEALASGAMVLHDRILSVPPGLEENVNIAYFDNQDELREKVMYYLTHPEERLAIARHGRQLAMCRSRTWHRMEQIILGRTVTPCYE